VKPTGQVVGPLAPGVKHLGRALPTEEHGAAEHRWNGQQLELERRDHAEVPAPAAQCPEQVRLVLAIDAGAAPVGQDELDRRELVRGHAVLGGDPADATAQRVAR
jgi:hypothetical protein